MDVLGHYSDTYCQVAKLRALLDQAPNPTEPLPRRQKRRQSRLSPAKVDNLCDGYRTGTRVNQLARQFGLDGNTVMEHARRQRLNSRHPVLNTRETKEAAKLYSTDLSLAAVSKQFGVHATTKMRSLRKGGR